MSLARHLPAAARSLDSRCCWLAASRSARISGWHRRHLHTAHTCLYAPLVHHPSIRSPSWSERTATSCSAVVGRLAKCYYTMNKVDKGRSFIRAPLASLFFFSVAPLFRMYAWAHIYFTTLTALTDWLLSGGCPARERYADLLSLFRESAPRLPPGGFAEFFVSFK